ncbi:MAG TPA: phosphomannomutase/phosphoglucomutase [Acidobacteriota bacterium]|nr:phosphomannomutase/phosphoglucomutase [Acidobacteriota bacterium]
MAGIFKAYDIRGIYSHQEIDMSFEMISAGQAYLIAQAHAKTQPHKKVVVGRDCRIGSEELQQSYIDGLRDNGVSVIDIGLCTTPQLYFAVNHFKSDGGVIITASHNPKEYNGVKLSAKKAYPISPKTGLDAIERFARNHSQIPLRPSTKQAQYRREDTAQAYADFLAQFMQDYDKLRVVIDASNGAVGHIIRNVLSKTELAARCINTTPDGNFPNHEPNPLLEASQKQAQKEVRNFNADVGFIFDGDGDRLVVIDENGSTVRGDLLIAWIGSLCVSQPRTYLNAKSNKTVVADLRGSKSIAEAVEMNDGTVIRTKVGRPSIIEAMQTSGAGFGGELSGHYYFCDFWNLDGGFRMMFAICNALANSSKPLSECLKEFNRYAKSDEVNIKCEKPDEALEKIRKAFVTTTQIELLDGITLSTSTWWCNVRPSNTEPYVRIVCEAENQKQVDEVLTRIRLLLE